MKQFKFLVKNVNTPGGRILVCLGVVCLGVACWVCGQDEAGKLILVGALATLWPLLSGKYSEGRER
jgi:hypothetical protein